MTPKYSKPVGWGFPDWQKEDQYPDPKTTLIYQWRWEFLRRNQQYQKDWKRFARQTSQQRLTPKIDKEGREGIAEQTPIPSINDPEFVAEMSNSMYIYGVPFLPNPNHPWPKKLESYFHCEGDRHLYDVQWGNETTGPWWGLEYVLYAHETVLRIDLRRKPVATLFQEIVQAYDLTEEMMEQINVGGKILSSPRRDMPQLFWKSGDNGRHPKYKGPTNMPRVFADPKYHGIVHVIFDGEYQPIQRQWDDAKAWLKSIQKSWFPDIRTVQQSDYEIWKKCLRIFDAKTPSSSKKWHKLREEEIGQIVLKIKNNDPHARKRVSEYFQRAKQLTLEFPY